ncbi:hypothetical protein BH10ACT2_BH10ACT2_16620 [soil metagenome]
MKVLVAMDGTNESLRAGREAVRLFADAEFLMIKVTQLTIPWMAGDQFGMVYPTSSADLLLDRPDVAELRTLADAAGLDDATVLNPVGDPGSAICAAAEEHDVDVVVIGSHDRGVLSRLISPSVTDAVVHGTHRAVLVVSGTPSTDAPAD